MFMYMFYIFVVLLSGLFFPFPFFPFYDGFFVVFCYSTNKHQQDYFFPFLLLVGAGAGAGGSLTALLLFFFFFSEFELSSPP